MTVYMHEPWRCTRLEVHGEVSCDRHTLQGCLHSNTQPLANSSKLMVCLRF